jgi:hypothetical protein
MKSAYLKELDKKLKASKSVEERLRVRVDYVYTFSAVRSRFRRGHKSVLLFIPDNGRLVRVTPSNVNKLAQRYRAINKLAQRYRAIMS